MKENTQRKNLIAVLIILLLIASIEIFFLIKNNNNQVGYSVDTTTQDYGEKMPLPITRKTFIRNMKSIGYEKLSEEEDGTQGKYATYYKPDGKDGALAVVQFFEMSSKQVLKYLAESAAEEFSIGDSENPTKDFDWNSDYNKHIACSNTDTYQCMTNIHVKNTLISITSFDASATEEILNAVNYW